MSKQNGLGDNLYVHGVNLSGDIQALGEIGGGPNLIDVTDITQSANSRIGGVRDGRINCTSYFDPAAGMSHEVLSAIPATDTILTYCRGTALGSPAAVINAKRIDYAGTRANDGALTFEVQAQGNGYGLEWGVQHTAGVRTDTTGTNGSSVDAAASTAFGLQAYLHVFGVTGTSVTVKLQESSDNGVGDSWADVVGGAFTAATGAGAERIQTTRDLTVERYLRVVTTGTFTNAQFSVVVVRNQTTVTF